MKIQAFLSLIVMSCGLARAGEFINLDFESVNESAISWPMRGEIAPGIYEGVGLTSELMPGWTMTVNETLSESIVINNWTINGPGIGLLQKTAEDLATSIDFIEGNYGFFGNVDWPVESLLLSQTGRIPDGARELRFSGFQTTPLINGELITRLPSGWYDITEYAGQEVELTWHFPDFLIGDNRAGLDSIAFVVPEPSTSALLGLGAAGLLWALRPRRKTNKNP